MAESTEKIEIHRGLQGVHFDRSRVCFIDGRAGELLYRGYSIHDLAERSTFEETCYLLLYGELPTRAELERFDAELKAARALPAGILDIIRTVRDAHPMDVLRTAVSALAAFDPEVARPFRGGDAAQGRAPHRAGADDRRRARGHPPRPRAGARRIRSLAHAANFLYMVTGTRAERQRRAADGRRHDPARRAWLERVGVHGAGRGRHQGQPARGDHRGDRRAVRARRTAAPRRT